MKGSENMQGKRQAKSESGYFRPLCKRPQIFLRPIDNSERFQMVLIDKPTPSVAAFSGHKDPIEKYCPSAGSRSSIGFSPAAASTPYKVRNTSKEIEGKAGKPGTRLTVSQFVGKPCVSSQSKKVNRVTRSLKDSTSVKLRNFVNERCKSFETILIDDDDNNNINRGHPPASINERRWQLPRDKGVNTEVLKKARGCGESLSSSFSRTNCSLKDFIFGDVKKLASPSKQVSPHASLVQHEKSLGFDDFLQQRHTEVMPDRVVTSPDRVVPSEYNSFLGGECYYSAKHNARESQLEPPKVATFKVPQNPPKRILNAPDKFAVTVHSKRSQLSPPAPFCDEAENGQISKDSMEKSHQVEKELQTLFSIVKKIQTDSISNRFDELNCDCTLYETAREAIDVGEADVEFWRNDKDLSVLIDYFQEKKV